MQGRILNHADADMSLNYDHVELCHLEISEIPDFNESHWKCIKNLAPLLQIHLSDATI